MSDVARPRCRAGRRGRRRGAGAGRPGEPLKTQRVQGPGHGNSATISIVTVLVLLALWFAVTNLGWVKPLFLPSPQAVFAQFFECRPRLRRQPLLRAHAASLFRVFGAFPLACLTAIPIGVLMGVSRVARGIFDPPIEFYRPLPPLAYLPMIIIWFGIGEFSKVYLIFLAIFAPLAIAARSGVRSGVASSRSTRPTRWARRVPQVIWHVILKSALPEIFTGMRIGIGVGWTTLVAAEMVAANRGLGFMVLNAAKFLRTDVVDHGHHRDRRRSPSLRPADALDRARAGAVEGADVRGVRGIRISRPAGSPQGCVRGSAARPQSDEPGSDDERGGQADRCEEHPHRDHPGGDTQGGSEGSIGLDEGQRPFAGQQQDCAPDARPPDRAQR